MTPTGLALLLGPLSLLIIFALFVRFKHVWQRKVAGFRWDRHIAPPPIGKTVPGAAGRHVAVVGGGIAGTSAAFALANAGAKVTLYECDNIVGGRCATVRRMVGKWPVRLERGVDSVTSGCLAADSLARVVKLGEEIGSINDYSYLFHRDKPRAGAIVPGRHWYAFVQASTPDSPLVLSWFDCARLALLRLSVAFSTSLWDPFDPKTIATPHRGALVGRSMEFASRSLGSTINRCIVEPLCRSMFGVAPDRLPSGYLYGMLGGRGMALAWNLENGMGLLPARLLSAHTGGSGSDAIVNPLISVHTGVAVSAVRWGGEGEKVILTSPLGEEEFDAVIVATPAPVAAALTSTVTLPLHISSFVSSAVYRPTLHASFLLKTVEFGYRPKCPNLLPVTIPAEYTHSGLEGCPNWVRNAVTSVTFPSGRLEANAPPGCEIVTVHLTSEAAAALLPFLTSRDSLPMRPFLPARVSRTPEAISSQVAGGSLSASPGYVTPAAARVADYIWDLARFSCPALLPDVYDDVLAVDGWAHGWSDFPPGTLRWSECCAVVSSQCSGESGAVLFAGDYLGGGTFEGALRSGLWAADGVLNRLTAQHSGKRAGKAKPTANTKPKAE